ncbi:twisted gastrulation protein homolog 1-A [Procambarus clarkii]|uniref:twisted gastrulation protein homolog 1-A n=1 Tax=Procambarus clarkii TaxID=6728 RepID=UPI001E6733B9|nr:twisted gastrulation protein homolog 1-A-like [Procambarus clarkii]
MRWATGVWACVVVATLVGVEAAVACNEVVCASMVSKCMLTQACKCDLTNSPGNNCTCCRDCAKCLGYLFTECCSCQGMCEPRSQVLDKTDSQVGDLSEPFQQLFQALAVEKDPLLRWTTMTFPIDVALSAIDTTTLDKSKYKLVTHPQDTAQVEQVTVNCTVLYWAQCVSGSKCKELCKTTGASAYRWFFDGCCECVGSPCINYGVNESRCIQCPPIDQNDENDDILTDQYLANNSADTFDEVAAQEDILSGNDPTV